jgi:hypothetical protein
MSANDDISGLVEKYMQVLNCPGLAPVVRVKGNLGAKWLGRCVTNPKTTPDTTVIELQSSILNHPETLERVLAHEMIHHVDFQTMSAGERALLARGRASDGHGRRFEELASVVNEEMGPDFVTVRSDEQYEKDENEREFYVLIEQAMPGRLGWSWSAKIGPKAEGVVVRKKERGAVLITSKDERFTAGVKIGDRPRRGMSVPAVKSELAEVLRELYEAALG